MRRVLISIGAIVLAACKGNSISADAADTFIAFNPSFAPFRTWTSFEDPGPGSDSGFPPAVLGARTQYINKLPPTGAMQFPVGTMIVEVRDTGTIFAGAKRGGGYNPGGAKGWEWFELTENPTQIFWRGVGPPLGDIYGGDPNGCNTCHKSCGTDNDYVCSPELQLAGF